MPAGVIASIEEPALTERFLVHVRGKGEKVLVPRGGFQFAMTF